MDPSRSHRLIHIINNCEGRAPDNTNSKYYFLYLYMFFFKVVDKNIREKQVLSGVDLGTSYYSSYSSSYDHKF